MGIESQIIGILDKAFESIQRYSGTISGPSIAATLRNDGVSITLFDLGSVADGLVHSTFFYRKEGWTMEVVYYDKSGGGLPDTRSAVCYFLNKDNFYVRPYEIGDMDFYVEQDFTKNEKVSETDMELIIRCVEMLSKRIKTFDRF